MLFGGVINPELKALYWRESFIVPGGAVRPGEPGDSLMALSEQVLLASGQRVAVQVVLEELPEEAAICALPQFSDCIVAQDAGYLAPKMFIHFLRSPDTGPSVMAFFCMF
jgi:hypothetical protein